MKHNGLKKQLSYFFAILLIMCTLSAEAVAADMNDESHSLMKWEEAPKSATLKSGEAIKEHLKYKLKILPEISKNSDDGKNNEILFSLGLSEGLEFPVSESEKVKVSENNGTLIYEDKSGEHILAKLDVSGEQNISIVSQVSEAQRSNSGTKDKDDEIYGSINTSGGDKSTLAFKVTLKNDNKEEKASLASEEVSSASDSIDEDKDSDSGNHTVNNDAAGGSESDVPVMLTVTIPTDILTAGKSFKQGEITLTAEAGKIRAEAVTTVKTETKAKAVARTNDAPDYSFEKTVESKGLTKNIFWADNNDEVGKRMTKEELASKVNNSITFTVGGKTYPLNETTMKYIRMTALPKARMNEDGVNAYTLTYPDNTFPTLLEDEEGNKYTVEWNFSQPSCDGYDSVEVNKENLKNYPSLKEQGENAYGWYYVLKTSVSFDVVLHTGASYNSDDKEKSNFNNKDLQNAVLNNFNFVVERPANPPMNILLKDIKENMGALKFEVHTGDDTAEDSPDEAEKTATITITNGWKYNVNGERMGYKVVQKTGEETAYKEGQIAAPAIKTSEAPGGVGDDYLKITYDNSGTTYASETDGTYEGGRLFLTLSGEAKYEGTKVWQDQGVGEGLKRPEAVLELWRYRNGQDFESATPVRNSRDEIVKMELNENESTEKIVFEAESSPLLDSLPKYDAEGYRYVYVVKEYLSGENSDKYQQVFGEITETAEGSGQFEIEDTLPDWLPPIEGTTTKRVKNNNYLYNGGTLSNCLNVDTNIKASKAWKASSFQAEFEDVIVEMTLQSRPKTADNTGIWSNASDKNGKEIRRVKYGFGEEELAMWNVEATVSKYGLLGREMEYKWVETAVYQAPEKVGGYNEETLREWYNETDDKTNLIDSDGRFTLNQNNRAVKYQSVAEINDDGVQIITNSLADTVNYSMEKKWGENVTPRNITFSIFQIHSGGTLNKDSEPYVKFKLDESGKIADIKKPDGSAIEIANRNNESWKAVVGNLPEFDESGAEYQYIMMEDRGSSNWIPYYKTTRDELGNYDTTVTNEPGYGKRIMIRKEWADDSDITHREPVTIEVYVKGRDKPIDTVILKENDEWNRFVSIDDGIDLNDVYIKEVKAGTEENENEVNYDDADWNNPAAVTGAYTGAHHNYEVSYTGKQEVLGEHVFSVRNHRVNDVNLTVNKLWKDNNGMFRKSLTEALKDMPEETKPTLSLRLKFQSEVSNEYDITHRQDGGDTVSVGLAPQHILNKEGKKIASIQKIDFGNKDDWTEYQIEYCFCNLPKYDVNGKVMHYTAEEVWLTGTGRDIPDLDAYLKEHLDGYPKEYTDLEEKLSEYYHSVTDQGYTTGELDSSKLTGLMEALHLRAKTVSADEQTIEFTNNLRGVKTVYWHKLWDDYYAYSNGNRPDIYLDIYRMVHKGTGIEKPGELTQVVEPYIRDYRWDSSANQNIKEVLDNGNAKNHWHVVLDNLPKYDEETGREYYYYAVERAKVNIKQFDYADVAYYIANRNNTGQSGSIKAGTDSDADNETSEEWPDTVTENMTKIGTARSTIKGPYLRFGFNNPAKAYKVPKELKPEVPLYKHYKYPDYMLLEGGYFSNTLDESVTIEGRKLWQSLPNSWPDTDLPAIKFSVYRSTETKAATEPVTGADTAVQKEFVATLTVTEWADPSHDGTYKFEIAHRTDKNGNPADKNGDKVESSEQAAKLPQYDEKGRRYIYTLIEDSIIWEDGSETNVSGEDSGGMGSDDRVGIFNTSQPGEKNFVATNAYNGVKGSLTVKKIVKLEKKANGYNKDNIEYVYPAVKFKLERYYYDKYDNDGQPSGEPKKDTTFSREKLLSSEEVKKAHEANQDYATGTLTFTDLEKYAPNGSEYLYRVTEDSEYLSGYDTWSATGNLDRTQIKKESNKDKVSVMGLSVMQNRESEAAPAPAATFLNEFQKDTQTKYPLVLRKLWRDYDDVFGMRPNTITVEMYRYADSQPGQNNSIKEKFATITLPTKENNNDAFNIDFKGHITDYKEDDISCSLKIDKIWIDGKNEDCHYWTLKEFEWYAPNGMPWKYVIDKKATEEKEAEPYQLTNNGDAWGWWNPSDKETPDNHMMTVMTNSIYTKVSFSKKWQDESGHDITTDYLGEDLTASFALQVKEDGSDKWVNANTYFNENLGDDALKKIENVCDDSKNGFNREIKGKITDKIWSGSFSNLPTAIKKNGDNDVVKLTYRVVETSFKYGKSEQKIAIGDDEATYNVSDGWMLKDAYFTADGNVTVNRLSTTSLHIQKIWSGDSFNQYNTRPDTKNKNNSWETTFVIQHSTDNGKNWDNVTEVTLYGKNSESMKEKTLTGLPTADQSGKAYIYRAREKEPGKSKLVENSGDTYYNGAYTVTYDEADGSLIAANILKPGGEVDKTYTSYAARKVWYPKEKPKGEEEREAVFALQYLADGSDGDKVWKTLTTVTLNGEADDNLAVDDSSGGSADRMVYGEKDPWYAVWSNVPLKHPDSYIPKDAKGTIYQVVETSYTPEDYITKTPVSKGKGGTYTFSFTNIQPTFLTVEKRWIGVEDTEKKDVKIGLYRTTYPKDIGKEDESLAVKDKEGTHLTKTLTEPNWKAEFDKLPAYDDEGNEYSYYGLELSVGGKPASESQYSIVYDYDTKANTTLITNVPTISVTGTKTWVDDGNRDGKRPEFLTLKIERSGGGTEPWEEVDAKPVWSETDKDVWKYTFSSLPKVSLNGLTYQYRVTEEMPNGYAQGNSDEENSFVNILSGETDFTVIKHWTYNGTDDLPELTLKLYRSTDGVYADDGEELVTETPEPVKNGDNWIYKYTGLEKYNENGVRYTYWVKEIIPEGYDAKSMRAKNNGILENIQQGSLMISKQVSGSRGEKEREFEFMVVLMGISASGVEASKVDGEYGDLLFNDGVAGFTLKHGESVIVTGLPAGLKYEIRELEADKDGYVTAFTGDSGIITSEMTVARFVNIRNDSTDLNSPGEGGDNPTVTDPNNPGGGEKSPMVNDLNNTRKSSLGTMTNDSANLLLWLILSMASIGVALALINMKRSNKKKSE